MISFKPCPKGYSLDLDKACSPEDTVNNTRKRLTDSGLNILGENKRIDTGRLGIPVFMSICGADAKEIMPVRKQMGKGASLAQAEASALMELVERYSYFYFWENNSQLQTMSWDLAEQKYQDRLLPLTEIIKSTNENLSLDKARQAMNLISWQFYPVTRIADGREFMAPVNWFKKLNEFNGSSAGNTNSESVLQGVCELVERHVSAIIDRKNQQIPTLDLNSAQDKVLQDLIQKFKSQGIKVWLKDFSLQTAVPTIGALAYDPSTFPHLSEIVFTAGTATSPEKAAIRALTEVAQLAGDFETASNFEPSGLSKFKRLEDTNWLQTGPMVKFSDLPCLQKNDILEELLEIAKRLQQQNFNIYAADLTHPRLNIAVHYNLVPGFEFRERSLQASLGLFIGRELVESYPQEYAEQGLKSLQDIYGPAPFLMFFKGMLYLNQGNLEQAAILFADSEQKLADKQDQGLAAFYQGYAFSQKQEWEMALPHLKRAIEYDEGVKEYFNMQGVCLFKQQDYEQAALSFKKALDLDSGSAMDMANLGLCHKFMNEPEPAKKLLSQALVLDPGLEFAANHLKELAD